MKKALFFTILLLLCLNISSAAQEVEIDIYKVPQCEDDAVLMSVNEGIKEAFSEKVTDAWDDMATSVKLYPEIKINEDDLYELYSMTVFDNPRYFYAGRGYSYTLMPGGYVGVLKLKYTTEDKSEIKNTLAEIDKATEEILLYIDPDMTDFEKIIAVHDYMINNYVYDITDADQTMLIMLDKVGVCAAYSEAFQHMMNTLGIEGTLVRSEAMGHIWNMVKLDGEWYHIDVTWDDPVPDCEAVVRHEHVLLSDNGIKALGHYGFVSPYESTSSRYDNAAWRDDSGMVTVDGVMYHVEGGSLIDEDGNIIYEKLDGGDGRWSIGGGYVFTGGIYAGVCRVNNIIYFNTDKGIYSYSPKDGSVETVLKKDGICGIYADKNTLIYNRFDIEESTFVKGGELRVADFVMAKPCYGKDEVTVRLYNDYDCPVWIIKGGEECDIERVEPKSLATAEFEGKEIEIFVWKENMEPVTKKVMANE